MEDRNIAVGLDLGSHRIGALIAERDGHGRLRVLGMGTAPSEGIRKGVLVDFDAAVGAIRHALGEAEASAGMEIRSAYVGVSGEHFRVIRSEGVHVKDGAGREITPEDVEQVVRVARGLQLPTGFRILHTLPVDFILDGREGIQDPVGMDGVRLQSQVLLVLGDESVLDNTVKAVERAGMGVEGLIFGPLATAMAALTRDEKEAGTVLLDLGDGTTDLLVLKNGSLVHASVLPLGVGNVSRDLSIGLSVSMEDAERLKLDYAASLSGKGDGDFPIQQLGAAEERVVTGQTLDSIIQPRIREILELAWDRARKAEVARRPSTGVVLCGGGALMPGLADLAAQLFDRGVRVAAPLENEGLLAELRDPRYTPLVGLVHYAFHKVEEGERRESGRGAKGLSMRRIFRSIARR